MDFSEIKSLELLEGSSIVNYHSGLTGQMIYSMIHDSTTGRASFTHTHWVLGFLLLCTGIMMPYQAFSAVTSGMAPESASGYPLSIDQPITKTWSAFDRAVPKNVCVRITNSGMQDLTVWLHHQETVVGLFTVLPQHISAICTMANKIELACTGESCESSWSVVDAP